MSAKEPVRVCCPRCGSRDTRSQGTEPEPEGGTVRRRICRACGKVFRTLERVAVEVSRYEWA